MSPEFRNTLIVIYVAAALFFSYLLYEQPAPAAELIQLRELSITARQFLPGGSYPPITDNGLPDRQLDKELGLHMDVDVLRYGYWTSDIHSMTDRTSTGRGQFRLVGLEFGAGIRLAPGLELGYWHYSAHELDGISPWHFPLQDAVQFKFYIYRLDYRPSIIGGAHND